MIVPTSRSAKEGSAAGLDSLNLSHVEGLAAETGRELGAVESDARGGNDGAELVAGRTAYTGADGALEGTVLLGVVAVGAEAGVLGGGGAVAKVGGKLAGRRGWVRGGAVVNGSW